MGSGRPGKPGRRRGQTAGLMTVQAALQQSAPPPAWPASSQMGYSVNGRVDGTYHDTRHDLRLTTARQAGREVRSWHMNAAEGLAAVDRMIAACGHGDRAATDYQIAW